MDEFINAVQFCLDDISNYKVDKQPINIRIIHKQYLAYYLYRIICKYADVFSISAIIPSGVIKTTILDLLEVPSCSKWMHRDCPPGGDGITCYALAGHMIRDDTALTLVISNMLDVFRLYSAKAPDLIDSNESHRALMSFISIKNTPEIIKEDLKKLYRVLPNLSGYAPVPNVIELLQPLENKTNQ